MSSSVCVRLASGAEIWLAEDDAARLVEELWEVSAIAGAVAAIGKLQHRLRESGGDAIELEGEELAAVAVALADESGLLPGLTELRRAARHAG